MFTAEAVTKLNAERLNVQAKLVELKNEFTMRNYQSAQAREHAQHGFARRIGTLMRCVDLVFDLLPLDLADIPAREETIDATICIQAFVFNVFGCLENVAWIWAYEKNVTQPNGHALNPKQVGLGDKYRHVWASFTEELRNYITRRQDWFDHLKSFRDSLAHRIPLYIPPYIVLEDKEADYHALAAASYQALLRGKVDESERLNAQKMALVRFWPVMTHSFSERAPRAAFHPQLLADANTVHEMGLKLLEELDR
jgi:hypothetical protein